jgi:hypothetical protein
MIDGATIATAIIDARRAGHGVVLTTDSTAALASYIAHLRQQEAQLAVVRKLYNKLQTNHKPFVLDNLADYVQQSEEALGRLRDYVAWVKEQK